MGLQSLETFKNGVKERINRFSTANTVKETLEQCQELQRELWILEKKLNKNKLINL